MSPAYKGSTIDRSEEKVYSFYKIPQNIKKYPPNGECETAQRKEQGAQHGYPKHRFVLCEILFTHNNAM